MPKTKYNLMIPQPTGLRFWAFSVVVYIQLKVPLSPLGSNQYLERAYDDVSSVIKATYLEKKNLKARCRRLTLLAAKLNGDIKETFKLKLKLSSWD